MSLYQALYRKYRPSNFDDVVGQEVVVETLKNALKSNKLSHAYLFSGPRGTGKTTLAKILAKAVNCSNLNDGISCDKCQNCLSILNNEMTDIIEIDAASNNGVDEIREIRNKINLVPSNLKYKVYIIDEVHMLSIGAFNALLKTLEEPPAHVIFVLATTDPHKVPVTIISRCQCFEFKRINDGLIVKRLKEICKFENIRIEEDVLFKIAKISEGGMRDALGILDKVSSYTNEVINIECFNNINGLVEDEMRKTFVDAVFNSEFSEIINLTNDIYVSGKSFVIFVQDLIEDLRDLMIDYYTNNKLKYSIKFIMEFIGTLNNLLIDLKNAGNLKVMFEASILSFIDRFNVDKVQYNEKKDAMNENKSVKFFDVKYDEKQENNEAETQTNVCVGDDTNKFKDIEITNIIVNNTFATAKKEYLLNLQSNWFKINDFVLDKSYGAAACFLLDSELRAVGTNELIISCHYESVKDRGLSLIGIMEELLSKIFTNCYHVALLTDDEWNIEKNNFIELKKQGKKYQYKDVDSLLEKHDIIDISESGNNISNDCVQQAISIFGKDIVKIIN